MASFVYKIEFNCGPEDDDTVEEAGIVVGDDERDAVDNLFDLYGDSENINCLTLHPLNPEDKVFIFSKEIMDKFLEEYIW